MGMSPVRAALVASELRGEAQDKRRLASRANGAVQQYLIERAEKIEAKACEIEGAARD